MILRRRYGASWLHLAGHLLALALVAYALSRVLDPRFSRGLNYVVWIVGGAVVHDLVLVPAYSLLDALARKALPGAAINYVRFPAVVSGAILLVYAPLIFATAEGNYLRSTGQDASGFATRWLLVTAALFLVSALAYGVRRMWGRP